MNMVDSREPAVAWAAAISNTLVANFTREKLERLLASYVEQLLGGGVLEARQIGRSMVEHDFIASATLEAITTANSAQRIHPALRET